MMPGLTSENKIKNDVEIPPPNLDHHNRQWLQREHDVILK
jgi:hypothetical protein